MSGITKNSTKQRVHHIGKYTVLSPLSAPGDSYVVLHRSTKARYRARLIPSASKELSQVALLGALSKKYNGFDQGREFLKCDNDRVYVIYEGVDVVNEIQYGGIGESLARKWFTQIVTTVGMAHAAGVVHGGLGPGCLVRCKDGEQIRVRGWGVDGDLYEGGRRRENCFCPEVLDGKCGTSGGGVKGDSWGLGVLLYWLLTGLTPFRGGDRWALYRAVSSGIWEKPEGVNVSKEAWDLVGKLLQRKPDDRLNIQGIMTHAWIRGERLSDKQCGTKPLTRAKGILNRDISILSASSCSDEAITHQNKSQEKSMTEDQSKTTPQGILPAAIRKPSASMSSSSSESSEDQIEATSSVTPPPHPRITAAVLTRASTVQVETSTDESTLAKNSKRSRGFLRRKKRFFSRKWSIMSFGGAASAPAITNAPSSTLSLSAGEIPKGPGVLHRNMTQLDLGASREQREKQEELEDFVRETLNTGKKNPDKSIASTIVGLSALGVDTMDDLRFMAGTMESAKDMQKWLGKRTSLSRSARQKLSKRLMPK